MDPALIKLALGGLAVLGCIGIVFGIGLALAAQKFAVEVNPKVEAVQEVLAGAQCGGCGFAGCEAYAEAVVTDPDVAPNLCFPGKEETAKMVADLTGKQMSSVENVIAFTRCSRIEGKVKKGSKYQGFSTCTAAKLAYGGPWECKSACIGFGECAEACPFNAITMVDNFPRVDKDMCVGCGTCIRTCPNNVMELIPVKARVFVPCNTKDKAKQVKEICESGCISCKICVKSCPAKAVSMENDIIKIDHKTCMEYGEECKEICVEKCPRNIFRSYKPDDFQLSFHHKLEALPMECNCCEDKCTS